MPSNAGEQLREVIEESTIQIPGVTNLLAARLVEDMGFHAAFLSIAALRAGALASSSPKSVDFDLLVQETERIAFSVAIPLVVEPFTGAAPKEQIGDMVRALETAGAAAIQLNDGPLTSEQMSETLATAASSRIRPSTVIIAGTAARSQGGQTESLKRVEAYLAAGAEWILPNGLSTYQDFAQLAERIDAPLVANMDEFAAPVLLTADELAEAGFAAVLYPMSLLRVAMTAMEGVLQSLADSGSQHEFLEIMQTPQQLARLLS